MSGSRSDLEGDAGDARVFYGDLDVRAVDFAAALASDDPMAFAGGPGEAPLHPSYEDRPGQADRVFAALDDLACRRQVAAWARALEAAGAAAGFRGVRWCRCRTLPGLIRTRSVSNDAVIRPLPR